MAIFPGDRTCAGHVSGAVEIRRQHSCVPIRAGKTVDKTVYVTGNPRLRDGGSGLEPPPKFPVFAVATFVIALHTFYSKRDSL
jgi:hypothetical protein